MIKHLSPVFCTAPPSHIFLSRLLNLLNISPFVRFLLLFESQHHLWVFRTTLLPLVWDLWMDKSLGLSSALWDLFPCGSSPPLHFQAISLCVALCCAQCCFVMLKACPIRSAAGQFAKELRVPSWRLAALFSAAGNWDASLMLVGTACKVTLGTASLNFP